MDKFVEYRVYNLHNEFPVLLLTGDEWRISDIPSQTLHFHNCIEIGICESNSGFFETLQDKFFFKAGDVTLVSPDIVHTTYSFRGTKSKWSYIFVDIEALLDSYFSQNIIDGLTQKELANFLLNRFLLVSTADNPIINHLVTMMIQVLQNKEPHYQNVFRNLLIAFIYSLMDQSKLVTQSVIDPLKSFKLYPALQLIRNDFSNHNLSVKELAESCNFSTSHFRRLFTKTMQSSPLDYLNLVRINASMRLLMTTNQSILEIAGSVGFYSISSFNRQFLLHIGLTPTKWRKLEKDKKPDLRIKYNGWMIPPKD